MDASADLLKVNHRLESRVPEIGLLGSEGGATSSVVPTPIQISEGESGIVLRRSLKILFHLLRTPPSDLGLVAVTLCGEATEVGHAPVHDALLRRQPAQLTVQSR